MPRCCYFGGMQKEHPFDRLARRLQTPLIWFLWVSAPIALFTYGKAMVAFIWSLPPALGVITFIAQIVALLGIASLFDRQQARRQSSEHGQSAQPQQTRRADPR